MFTLDYERRHNVLLVRFTGIYSSQDIADLDIALIGFAARQGPAHIIRDLSSVEGVAVPSSKIVQRGQEPPINPGYSRITVAPRPDLHEVASVYGAQQTLAGNDPPKLVLTLNDALHELNIVDPNFESVEQS
jgi:hypothetical protein